MKLSEAMDKCKSLGMRLPTARELKIAKMFWVIQWWPRNKYSRAYWAKIENEGTYNLDVTTGNPTRDELVYRWDTLSGDRLYWSSTISD